jgi:pimeloyl-ACP methyl ester carboxylesterase
MLDVGRDASHVLPDGRTLEYWAGGDPTGRPVVFHPGTPASRLLGRWGHEPAVAAGIRLVSLNRPGYGGSTPITTRPSLLAMGADTAELATHLGFDQYAVLGISGGGPFALATAIADPSRARALAVVGPVGPWAVLDEPTDEDRADREFLAQLDDGDVAGAFAGLHAAAEREMAPLRILDDDARVDAILDEAQSPLVRDDEYRALWAANMAVVLNDLNGYVFDNLAWGGTWDADPRDVAVPTAVWDADGQGGRHGQWYAEQIPAAELTIYADEGHLDVCDGHWPEVLTTVLRLWDGAES